MHEKVLFFSHIIDVGSLHQLLQRVHTTCLAAAVGKFEESKNMSIHAKLGRFNENYEYINQIKVLATGRLLQHKRGFTKLLKATN